MPKPVCVHCQTEYRILKTGAWLIEMFLSPPQPYKIWLCDVWQCPGCKHQIVNGFGKNPMSEHFEDDFQKVLQGVLAQKEWVLFTYEKPFSMARDYAIQNLQTKEVIPNEEKSDED